MNKKIVVRAVVLCVALTAFTPTLASTLFGGSASEGASLSVRDASGNIYVVGGTSSTDFPVTAGAYDTSYNGGTADLFVAKFDSSLANLLAATYVGGSGDESYPTLAIDPSGNLLVAGRTSSTDIPVTAGAYQTSKNADFDLFVVKLDSNLTSVLAATYLGGSKTESWGALAMGVDSTGNPVLGCRSTSEDFPTTAGAHDTTYNDYAAGHGDTVVAKLDSTLSSLLASTFIGGALWDEARVLHVDFDDTVLVGGDTQNSTSYGAFYPTTAGAYATCANHAFSREAFVSRFSADLSTLVASTCFGRSGTHDMVYGVRTATDGSVMVVGRTTSSTFPVTSGAYDTTLSGGEDGYVVKFDYGLTTLVAGTFLGGSTAVDIPTGLLIDSAGSVQVSGGTESADFPTTVDAFDSSLGGTRDGFHVKLNADLSSLEYGTYIGGSANDWANTPLQHGSHVFVNGSTDSTDFPTTSGAYDETHNGGTDGFVTGLGVLVHLPLPADSTSTRWATGALLFALLGFAMWRMFARPA